jgi:hypothetical protein
LLPSIYPWLWNRCLAINNSSLLVFRGYESCTRCLAIARLEHTYFLRYFGPLGRMSHFSRLVLFLIFIQSDKIGKWNYTIHRKIVMSEHTYTYTHTHTYTYIHTYIHFYIDRLADSPSLPRYILDSHRELSWSCSFPFITSAINCCRRYIRGYGTVA